MKPAVRQGVFYDIHDYAGIGRRLIIVLIDLFVAGCLVLMAYLAALRVASISEYFVVYCILIVFVYFAVLPTTSVGTVGYCTTGVRLVDLYGRPASLWRSTFRVGFMVFGPGILLADIIWLCGDPNRQSIRDKFAGTYVIRRKAQPLGSAAVKYKNYCIFTYNLMFAEVDRNCAATQPASSL